MSGSDERARGTSPRARGRTVQVTTRRGRLLQRLVGQEPSRQSVGVSREVVPRSPASVGDERSGLARAVRTGGNGGGSKRGPEGNEADFVGGNEVSNNSPHRCPVTRAHRMKPADRFGGGSGHWWRRRCKPRRAAGPRGVSPPDMDAVQAEDAVCTTRRAGPEAGRTKRGGELARQPARCQLTRSSPQRRRCVNFEDPRPTRICPTYRR